MNKVWAYVRVSSKDQNIDRQINEVLPLVSTESHVIVEHASGKNFERIKYQSLKNLMDNGDTLIIKSLDRLGRNYTQIKEEWYDLQKKGIFIKILDMPLLDTSKYINDNLMAAFLNNIVLEVLSYVAENERKNIRQRQKEGIEIAKKKGKHLGRPRAEYPDNWESIYYDYKNGKIKAVDAIRLSNLKKTTFYKLIKQYENK